MDKLLKRVAFEYEIPVEEMFKPTLTNTASEARKVVIYFLQQKMDGREIQEYLKIKCLSTVYNSVTWWRDTISFDKDLQGKIKRIQRDVRGF